MLARNTLRTLRVTLVMALFMLWTALAQLPLFDEDEGEYAEVAVEMAHSGDVITPTLNGVAFFEKPILAFWLESPLVHALGVHPWVFRLPSLIACLIWFLVIAQFARRQWHDEETALLAAILTATSLSVVVSAHAAAMDGILCLLTTLALLDIYKVWESDDRRANWRVFIWMGLGFLAKGPIAVVIPLVTSLLFYLMQGEGRRWLKGAFNLRGWLIFCAIALPWYIAQYLRMGAHFIDDFVLRENLGRLTGSLQGHGGGWFYYVPVLLLLAWPHTALLLRAGVMGVRDRTTPLTLFLLLWFSTVFVIFSLAHTKLPHYLLPGLTPLVLLMAKQRQSLRSWLPVVLPSLLMACAAACLPFYLANMAHTLNNPYLQALTARGVPIAHSMIWRWVGMTLATLVVALYTLSQWRFNDQRAAVLSANGLLGTLWVVGLFLPLAAALQQEPVLQLAQLARTHQGPIVADNRMPSFAVAIGHPTENRAPRPGDWVFLRADHLKNLPPYSLIRAVGGLCLVRIL